MDVGFIGVGGMGSAIAARVLEAGHRLRAWNRSPEAAKKLEAQGAEAVAAPRDAFQGDAVISMLADDRAVRAVFIDSGLLEARAAGLGARGAPLVHINMATLSLACVAQLAKLHESGGIAYVAAPVLGRPDVVAAGKLHILAAGHAEAVERVRPLLDAIGQRTWWLGEQPVRANAMKLLCNFLIAAAIEGMAEAMALGKQHGLEASLIQELLSGTLFGSPVYQGYGKLIAEGRFEPAAFRLALGLKDMRLVLAAAESVNVPLPLASLLHDNFLDAMAHGDADKDWAALARVSFRRADLAR